MCAYSSVLERVGNHHRPTCHLQTAPSVAAPRLSWQRHHWPRRRPPPAEDIHLDDIHLSRWYLLYHLFQCCFIGIIFLAVRLSRHIKQFHIKNSLFVSCTSLLSVCGNGWLVSHLLATIFTYLLTDSVVHFPINACYWCEIIYWLAYSSTAFLFFGSVCTSVWLWNLKYSHNIINHSWLSMPCTRTDDAMGRNLGSLASQTFRGATFARCHKKR